MDSERTAIIETIITAPMATALEPTDINTTGLAKEIDGDGSSVVTPLFYIVPVLVCAVLTYLVFIRKKQSNDTVKPPPSPQQRQLQQTSSPSLGKSTPATTPTTQKLTNTNSPKTSSPAKTGPKPTKDSSSEDEKTVTIFFGSQTGTAEDFAKILAEEMTSSYGYTASVQDLENYDHDSLGFEKFVIFCLATYGDGEPTDNAKDFHDWLVDENDGKDEDMLKDVKFTVFGLGNKTYDRFNAMARIFDKRLEQLGATRIYKRGEGDDDCSLEEDFTRWKTGLWHVLSPKGALEEKRIEPKTELVFLDELPEKNDLNLRRSTTVSTIIPGTDPKKPAICKVILNKELHSPYSDRSCKHVEIELPPGLHYEAGDHLGVFPENDPELVDELAKLLNVDLDKLFTLVAPNLKGSQVMSSPKTGSGPVMGPCSIRNAFSKLLDINSLPRMNTIKVLAQYTQDEKEKAELISLCADTEEALQKYASFIKGDTRNFVDVLKSFPSCKPPLGHFLEMVPRLQPRFYSISSSPNDKESVLSITSVVVEYKTLTGRHNKGVCSSYLATLVPTPDYQPPIEIFVRHSNFKLPPNSSTPIIMIGPGTGLAPFRGFIQERKYLAEKAKKNHTEGVTNGKVDTNKSIGESVLFFGCRHSEQDYLYRDELATFVQDNIISRLFVAFSRESTTKVYVQDHLKQYADEFWHLMKTAYIYVCGDAKNMAKDVHKTLIELCMEKESMTEEQAQAFINNISSAGRYLQDIWT